MNIDKELLNNILQEGFGCRFCKYYTGEYNYLKTRCDKFESDMEEVKEYFTDKS